MTVMVSTIERSQKFTESVIVDRSVESSVVVQKESYIGDLVSKLSKY